MVSDYVITELHTRRVNPVVAADPVAVAHWPTDTHSVRRVVRDGAAYNEGFVFDDDTWGPFGISYRALTHRRAEAVNLLAPTCPSSSHVAYGAIRLEQTFLALGQAAAAAAVLAHWTMSTPCRMWPTRSCEPACWQPARWSLWRCPHPSDRIHPNSVAAFILN